MVIYGEYLFIENFIAGLLLILLTGKLTGRMPAKMRILLAAVLCGLSGFIIFLPLNGGWSAVLRLLAGTLCAAAAFGLREIVKTTGLFLALTFLSGGAVMALLLWRQQPAVSHQGIIYMDAVTYSKAQQSEIRDCVHVYYPLVRYGRLLPPQKQRHHRTS